jgi:hypothetical protein
MKTASILFAIFYDKRAEVGLAQNPINAINQKQAIRMNRATMRRNHARGRLARHRPRILSKQKVSLS